MKRHFCRPRKTADRFKIRHNETFVVGNSFIVRGKVSLCRGKVSVWEEKFQCGRKSFSVGGKVSVWEEKFQRAEYYGALTSNNPEMLANDIWGNY